ncbi:UNVERIFIED_CONTAM: hypothetical protein RMT77_000621 [Armadillidium vulgare]
MNFQKLGPVMGNINLYNEIICTKLKQNVRNYDSVTVYFGGDVQDYPEVMSSHRDHGKYIQWNLLNMVSILSLKFPSSIVCVIKPKRIEFKTFSCYDNFVPSNNLGAPTYTELHGSLSHLRNLLKNALSKLSESANSCEAKENTCTNENDTEKSLNINLIGFSKGCVVLNQLITEIYTLSQTQNEENDDLLQFWRKIKSIYWLDGGHSGGKHTWITQRSILNNLATFPDLSIHVHVTPYQVRDERRPWIRTECKSFVETLKRANANISYKLHFEEETPSLEKHFEVLDAFTS